MAWPDHIQQKFELVNPNTDDEFEWYGPYNALLNYLFPSDQDYTVAPQDKGLTYERGADRATIYVVWKGAHPVFFIEFKPREYVENLGSRATADSQMRERFRRLVGRLAHPKLFGISAMGTRLAIYEYDKATNKLHPEEIERIHNRINDCAPASRWEHELLEAGGEVKIREIAASITGVSY